MRRLVVVSNRVASNEDAYGGLSVALAAALQGENALWFGWSGRLSDRPGGDLERRRLGDIEVATIDLETADVEAYYDGYANACLWPLFHARRDLVAYDRRWRDGYLRANRRFASALMQLLRPGDWVWVHDYHLIPLGRELRRLGFAGPIGFFLHTPWPDAQLLAILPDAEALVTALFDYDLVGMQTEDCVAALQAYVLREADGWAQGPLVSAFGRRLRIEAFPIGLDTPDFQRLAVGPDAACCHRRLTAYRGPRSLIIGVDRLDYSKGLSERLAGFEAYLTSHPEMAPKVLYLQIAPTSRPDVSAYQVQRESLLAQAGRVNATWADIDYAPVLCLNRPFSRAELAGAYRAARVGLVTPLCDGMNLVAKEYVAAQDPEDPGVLVLSRFAGAARQMRAALIVNPYDRAELADALAQALAMPREERLRRWRALMDGVARDDVNAWRDDFLTALEGVARGRPLIRRLAGPLRVAAGRGTLREARS